MAGSLFTAPLLLASVAFVLTACGSLEMNKVPAERGAVDQPGARSAVAVEWLEMSVFESAKPDIEDLWFVAADGRAVRGARIDGVTKVNAWARVSRDEFAYLDELLASCIEADLAPQEEASAEAGVFKLAAHHVFEFRVALFGTGGLRVYHWRHMYGGPKAWALQSLIHRMMANATWHEGSFPNDFEELRQRDFVSR